MGIRHCRHTPVHFRHLLLTGLLGNICSNYMQQHVHINIRTRKPHHYKPHTTTASDTLLCICPTFLFYFSFIFAFRGYFRMNYLRARQIRMLMEKCPFKTQLSIVVTHLASLTHTPHTLLLQYNSTSLELILARCSRVSHHHLVINVRRTCAQYARYFFNHICYHYTTLSHNSYLFHNHTPLHPLKGDY